MSAADASNGRIGPNCPSCGRDNREHGNICTSDDCPANPTGRGRGIPRTVDPIVGQEVDND